MLSNYAVLQFARMHMPDLFCGIKAEDEIHAIASRPLCHEWAENEIKRLDLHLRKHNYPVTAHQIAAFLGKRGETFNFE